MFCPVLSYGASFSWSDLFVGQITLDYREKLSCVPDSTFRGAFNSTLKERKWKKKRLFAVSAILPEDDGLLCTVFMRPSKYFFA